MKYRFSIALEKEVTNFIELAHQLARAAYINLVSASDVASREYPAVSQMDVSVGKKGK